MTCEKKMNLPLLPASAFSICRCRDNRKMGNKQPSMPHAELRALGNAALVEQRYDDAIEKYTKALRQDMTNDDKAKLYSNRSYAYLFQQKRHKALSDATECVRLSPGWTRAHFRLGCAYEAQGRIDKALLGIEASLRIQATDEALAARDRLIGRRAELMRMHEHNKIIIYVWNESNISIGHVAIKTPRHYISFWPGGEVCKERWMSLVQNMPGAYRQSYEADVTEGEAGVPASVVVCLYSLNVFSADQKYLEMKQRGTQYTLAGAALLANARNCASFAFDVLMAAGIERLMYRDPSSIEMNGTGMFASPVVPEDELGTRAYETRYDAAYKQFLKDKERYDKLKEAAEHRFQAENGRPIGWFESLPNFWEIEPRFKMDTPINGRGFMLSIVKKPDDMGNMAKLAKRHELYSFPGSAVCDN